MGAGHARGEGGWVQDIADAAYIASRAQTYEDCRAMDHHHCWDDGTVRAGEGTEVIGEWLLGAIGRYDRSVDHHSHLLVQSTKVLASRGN